MYRNGHSTRIFTKAYVGIWSLGGNLFFGRVSGLFNKILY